MRYNNITQNSVYLMRCSGPPSPTSSSSSKCVLFSASAKQSRSSQQQVYLKGVRSSGTADTVTMRLKLSMCSLRLHACNWWYHVSTRGLSSSMGKAVSRGRRVREGRGRYICNRSGRVRYDWLSSLLAWRRRKLHACTQMSFFCFEAKEREPSRRDACWMTSYISNKSRTSLLRLI